MGCEHLIHGLFISSIFILFIFVIKYGIRVYYDFFTEAKNQVEYRYIPNTQIIETESFSYFEEIQIRVRRWKRQLKNK